MISFAPPKGFTATRQQVEELFTILSIMRPHESKMEAKFIDQFIRPLKPDVDKCGNLIVKVGHSPVLWSCHVDTVHTFGGIAPIEINEQGVIHVPKYSLANCLGADDGSGVWLMLQMIRAERPGVYVFHRGEERGGIGSKWIAKNTPKLLDGIECAIAFDRKGTGSIITHQWGGRCCSEDFSASLADAIGLGMKSDTGGSFTDTAAYVDLVGECTNVSVGYYGQHGKFEEQELPFLLDLHQRMLEVDVRDLKFKRRPGEKEKNVRGRSYGGDYSRGWGWSRAWDSEEDYSYIYSPKLKWESGKVWDDELQGYVYANKVWDNTKKKWIEPDKSKTRNYMDSRSDVKVCRRVWSKTSPSDEATEILVEDNYLSLVMDYPEEIAEILAEKQYGIAYLHEQIRKHGGNVVTAYKTDGKTTGTA